MPTLGRIKWRRCESRESSLRYVKRELRPHRQQHVLANRPHCGGPPWRRPGGWRGGNVRGEPTVTVSNVRDKVSALNVRSSPLRREDASEPHRGGAGRGPGSRRPRPDAAAGSSAGPDAEGDVESRRPYPYTGTARGAIGGAYAGRYAGREQAVRSKIAARGGRTRARIRLFWSQ